MFKNINLDSNSFPVFYVASDVLNFTRTAEILAMTPSGVSQHINKLEESIGAELFKRINKKVVLTDEGKKFKQFLHNYFDCAENLLSEIQKNKSEITGTVKYAMPESCLMSPHFKILLKRRKKEFSKLNLEVEILPSEKVLWNIVEDKIDFGFMTKKIENPSVEYIPFCKEEIAIIAHSGNQKYKTVDELLENGSFINHPFAENLFETWVAQFRNKKKLINWNDLKMNAGISSLYGVKQLLDENSGFTILPVHTVQAELNSGKYELFNNFVSANQIYIAKLKNINHPKRVEVVVNSFIDMI